MPNIEKISLNSLLSRVSGINNKYVLEAQKTGENFNMFKLFKIETKENSTHSRFIIELLDPKGSHDMGDVFLKSFVKRFTNLDLNFATTTVGSKYISPISNDETEGGSIDIFITDRSSAIVIENKIYAPDQKNQLLRYRNYVHEIFKNTENYNILYLSLEGTEPGSYTTGNKNFEVKCVSYKVDIIEWLKSFIDQALLNPIIKETINQYIFLLKDITNQTSTVMKEEEILNEVLSKPEFISSFFNLYKVDMFQKFKKKMMSQFIKQMEELANELDLLTSFNTDFGFSNSPSYLIFILKDSPNNFYISLCFCKHHNNLVYQVNSNETSFEIDDNSKGEVLKVLPPRDDDFEEIWIKWFEQDLRNWDSNPIPWMKIKDQTLKQNIKEKFKELLPGLKDFDERN